MQSYAPWFSVVLDNARELVGLDPGLEQCLLGEIANGSRKRRFVSLLTTKYNEWPRW